MFLESPGLKRAEGSNEQKVTNGYFTLIPRGNQVGIPGGGTGWVYIPSLAYRYPVHAVPVQSRPRHAQVDATTGSACTSPGVSICHLLGYPNGQRVLSRVSQKVFHGQKVGNSAQTGSPEALIWVKTSLMLFLVLLWDTLL